MSQLILFLAVFGFIYALLIWVRYVIREARQSDAPDHLIGLVTNMSDATQPPPKGSSFHNLISIIGKALPELTDNSEMARAKAVTALLRSFNEAGLRVVPIDVIQQLGEDRKQALEAQTAAEAKLAELEAALCDVPLDLGPQPAVSAWMEKRK